MSNKVKETRAAIKKLAQQMESLAHEVQLKLDQGSDVLMVSNELVRNSNTFVFSLGELYALESKKNTATNATTNVVRKYHNVRDALGRFARV